VPDAQNAQNYLSSCFQLIYGVFYWQSCESALDFHSVLVKLKTEAGFMVIYWFEKKVNIIDS